MVKTPAKLNRRSKASNRRLESKQLRGCLIKETGGLNHLALLHRGVKGLRDSVRSVREVFDAIAKSLADGCFMTQPVKNVVPIFTILCKSFK